MFAGIFNFSEIVAKQDCLNEMSNISKKLKDLCKQHFDIETTIAISEVKSGILGIHTAYVEALQTMEYRFILGKGAIIYYSDISKRNFEYDYFSDSKTTQILLAFIQSDIYKPACSIVSELFLDASLGENASIETIECFKYGIAICLNKIIYEIFYN